MAPRYFNAKAQAQTPRPTDPQAAVHLLDVFILETAHLPPEEWFVTLSHDGALLPIRAKERHLLSPRIQEELSFYEVSGKTPRRLLFSELSIFLVQLMEQPPNTPGVNDPIYLYGTLYSPLPLQAASYTAADGQLTITRADLLEGLTAAAPWAFCYPNTGGSAGCCFSMLLPADRPEVLSQGRGAILAYALLAPELAFEDAANDAMINQLLYDTLAAMKDDMKAEGNPPDMLPTLPVLSRSSHEQKLISDGYTIEGNTAFQRGKGFLSALFGKKLELPSQGDTPTYLKLAEELLSQLPGWPEPKALALRKRQLTGQQSSPTVAPSPSATPQYSVPPPPPPPNTPRPSDWMNDFIEAHHQPGTPPPRITPALQTRRPPPRPAPPPPTPSSDTPDWMKDFE